MDWPGAFLQYLEAPHRAWPPDRPLQADKLEKYGARRAGILGITPQEMRTRCLAAAERRVKSSPPTLFLINCGSSGSHWVEAMLASLPGIHACGEVYVPPGPGERLSSAEEPARAGFLDALHQIHMEKPGEPGDDDILINSAHSWNPHDLMGGSARPVLLVRDPVDVVISRTFRKPKLRRHVAPSADDMVYLEKNAAMVEKFYRSAFRRKPPTIVRYESLIERPETELARLLESVGRSAAGPRLREIALQHSRESQRTSGHRLSNVYEGPSTAVPPEFLGEASERLARLRADLGYS